MNHLQTFFSFVRAQPCAICHSGNWDMDKGEFCNTVSHVLKKGSTRRNQHYNSIVAMCVKCHAAFELEKPKDRERFRKLAISLTERFVNGYFDYEKDRKKMWDMIRGEK